MNNEPAITIDLSYLHTLTCGDKVFEKELLRGAVDDIQVKVDDLEKAWQCKDDQNIRKNVHSLKSLTAIAGIPQIQHWSQVIDQLFSAGIFNIKGPEPVAGIINGWVIAKMKLENILATY